MGISTFSLFESAKRGLTANQYALTVVSQNVSNASTDGYTRQEITLKNTAPEFLSGGMQVGTGVEVAEVRQVRDRFIESQVRTQNQTNSYWTLNQSYLERIQTVLSDSTSNGISSLLDKFWKASEDVSNSPQSQTTRIALKDAGSSLTAGIKYISAQLSEIRGGLKDAVTEKVNQINNYAKKLAELNTALAKGETQNAKLNDIRDERTRVLNSLSALTDIKVSDMPNLDDGQVYINGKLLVNGASYDELTVSGGEGGNPINISWKNDNTQISSNPEVATAEIFSNAADGIYNIDVLELASGFSVSSNQMNISSKDYLSKIKGASSGTVSVNGKQINVDINKLTPESFVELINRSEAGVTASLDNAGRINIVSNDTGTASKINLSDGTSNIFEKLGLISSVTGKPSPEIKDINASLNISGTFEINGKKVSITQGQTDSLNRIVNEINNSDMGVKAALITDTDGTYKVKIASSDGTSKIQLKDTSDNLLFRLGILDAGQPLTIPQVNNKNGTDAKLKINGSEVISSSNNVKNAAAGLEIKVSEKGQTQIEVKKTITSGEIGALLNINDAAIPKYMDYMANFVKTITSGVNNIHRSGFDLNGSTGINFFNPINYNSNTDSKSIIDQFSMNQDILLSVDKIAAAGVDESYYSTSGQLRSKGVGDNTTALALTELKTKTLFSDNTTITQKYSEIIASIGNDTKVAINTAKNSKSILTTLQTKRESISGVSMDEEISNMLKYQHSYNASAKMINVIDGMIDKIVNGLIK